MIVNKPGLLALFQSLTGLVGPASVVWVKDQRPFISPIDGAIYTLQLIHRANLGVDDVTQEFTNTGDDNTSTLTTDVRGLRQFVIQVRLDMYFQDAEAQDTLDTLSLLMQAPWVTTQLSALNYGLVSISSTNELETVSDNRIVSSAVMDITFNATNIASQATTGGGWIATFNYNDTIQINSEARGRVTIRGPRCAAVCG